MAHACSSLRKLSRACAVIMCKCAKAVQVVFKASQLLGVAAIFCHVSLFPPSSCALNRCIGVLHVGARLPLPRFFASEFDDILVSFPGSSLVIWPAHDHNRFMAQYVHLVLCAAAV